jgi:hypothetical protein
VSGAAYSHVSDSEYRSPVQRNRSPAEQRYPEYQSDAKRGPSRANLTLAPLALLALGV